MLPPGCEQRCVACRHRELDASESEALKFQWLSQKLEPWRNQLECTVGVPAGSRLGYRDKACLRARWSAHENRWILGLLRRSRVPPFEEEIIEIPNCPVHSERVRAACRWIAGALPDQIPLSFVVMTGKLMTLVLKSPPKPELLSRVPIPPPALGLSGLWVCFNASAGERVFSHRTGDWHLVWGSGSSRLSLLERDFLYGPSSFQQALPELFQQALLKADKFLSPKEGDSLVDLCSGIGISLSIWRERGARTIGVELSGEAVLHSAENAGPDLCLRGRVSERIPQLNAWREGEGGRRLLFANPPRLGLERAAVDWIARDYRPERFAYLSCSAGTLARDLSLLTVAGYVVRKIIPYDFFPFTDHVEALALLEIPVLDSSPAF